MICDSLQIIPDPKWWNHWPDPYTFEPIASPRGNLSALIKEHVSCHYPPTQICLEVYSPGFMVFKSQEDAILFKLRLNLNANSL